MANKPRKSKAKKPAAKAPKVKLRTRKPVAEPADRPEVAPVAKVGAPTKYTQALADKLCAGLADGLSLRAVCLNDDMPDKATVFRWLRTNEEFRDQYARAKQESADALADEILDIADDGTNDWMEKEASDGRVIGWAVNGEAVQRSKIRVEARKWIASKMKPKVYGDKLELGGKLENTVRVVNMTGVKIGGGEAA